MITHKHYVSLPDIRSNRKSAMRPCQPRVDL